MDIILPDEYEPIVLIGALKKTAEKYNLQHKINNKRFNVEESQSLEYLGYDLRKGSPELMKKVISTTVWLQLERVKKIFPITLKKTETAPEQTWENDNFRFECYVPQAGRFKTIILITGFNSPHAQSDFVTIKFKGANSKEFFFPGSTYFHGEGQLLLEEFLQLFVDCLDKPNKSKFDNEF